MKKNLMERKIRKRKKRGPLVRLVRVLDMSGVATSLVPVDVVLRDPGPKTPPFVPPGQSRLGNQDNRGFPTGTN